MRSSEITQALTGFEDRGLRAQVANKRIQVSLASPQYERTCFSFSLETAERLAHWLSIVSAAAGDPG